MRFGVSNRYDDFFYAGNDHAKFNHPEGFYLHGNAPLRMTDQGIVIFNLGKDLALPQKLALASNLDVLLERELDTKLSFALSNRPSGLNQELVEYFHHMKKLNPDITTILKTVSLAGKWQGHTTEAPIDHVFNQTDAALAERIIKTLKPRPIEKSDRDWAVFEGKIIKLLNEATENMRLSENMSVTLQRDDSSLIKRSMDRHSL